MLYLVSTPVGNLKDISLRALEILKEVDIIACEDTRTSLKLLNHYEIKKPLVSYHKFNEKVAGEKLLAELNAGKNVALITDAGTPVISDPGNVLCKMLVENEVEYTVIPGATAFVPALLLSGMDASKFSFIGFLPEKKKDIEELLASYKNLNSTLIFYCAPHDVKKTVEVLYSNLGERNACAVKEITKLHEKAWKTTISELIAEYEANEPKGEHVLVIAGKTFKEKKDASIQSFLEISIEEHMEMYLSKGMDKKEAMKAVAKDRGVSKRDIYDALIEK